MKSISEYSYSSTLLHITPMHKIAFGVIPLLISLGFNSILVSVITIIAVFYFSIKYSKVSIKTYIGLMLIPIFFLVIGTVTIIFGEITKGQIALVYVTLNSKLYGISDQSLLVGIRLILKALACVSCMYFICLTTPMTDILQALKKLKVPTVIISLMELIYRYIFVLLEEAEKMRTAQMSRLGYVNLKTSIKSAGQLIGTLFIKSYTKCDRVYSALQSRGYATFGDGSAEIKTLDKDYDTSKSLIIIMVILNLILITVGVASKLW